MQVSLNIMYELKFCMLLNLQMAWCIQSRKICSKIFDYTFSKSGRFFGLKVVVTSEGMMVLNTGFSR